MRYVYDGLGRRLKVEGTDPSSWTVSIFAGMDAVFEKTSAGATTKYVYAAGLRTRWGTLPKLRFDSPHP